MAQEIYLKNNKLVIKTDNGIIEDGKTTTSIGGEFIINASEVAELMSLLNGMNFAVMSYQFISSSPYHDSIRRYVASKTTAELTEMIKDEYEHEIKNLEHDHLIEKKRLQELIDDLRSKLKDSSNEIKQLRSEKFHLQERINNHNSKLFTFKKI